MSLARTLAFTALAVSASVLVTACSGGTVNVGSTSEHELKKKTDGGASGNGQTCSFDDVVWYDAQTGETGTIPSASGQYTVGDTFPSPDGCNTCTCTKDGISCTEMACSSPPSGGPGCTEEAKTCPDGTTVWRTGPNCDFIPCPGDTKACPEDAKVCPDGTSVGRTGPNCEFAPCPVQVCTQEAMLCPDGKTYVSRTGPNCEFAPCPK